MLSLSVCVFGPPARLKRFLPLSFPSSQVILNASLPSKIKVDFSSRQKRRFRECNCEKRSGIPPVITMTMVNLLLNALSWTNRCYWGEKETRRWKRGLCQSKSRDLKWPIWLSRKAYKRLGRDKAQDGMPTKVACSCEWVRFAFDEMNWHSPDGSAFFLPTGNNNSNRTPYFAHKEAPCSLSFTHAYICIRGRAFLFFPSSGNFFVRSSSSVLLLLRPPVAWLDTVQRLFTLFSIF